jgi:hypothetical protein
MDLAFQVGEDAQKIAKIAKQSADRFRSRREGDEASEAAPAEAGGLEAGAAAPDAPQIGETPAEAPAEAPSLDHVLAWNRVLLNQEAACAKCGVPLPKGAEGFLGLSQDPSRPPSWLCATCAETI